MSQKNDEILMTKQEGMTKSPNRTIGLFLIRLYALVLHPSFLKFVFARGARYPDRCSGARRGERRSVIARKSGRQDLNLRPRGPKPRALPS